MDETKNSTPPPPQDPRSVLDRNSTAGVLTTLADNDRLLTDYVTALCERVNLLEETLDSLLGARESDYVYAITARRIRDARLPRSRAEAALMWMYVQWRRHGDNESAYEPMPTAAVHASDRRQEAHRSPHSLRRPPRSGPWAVQG